MRAALLASVLMLLAGPARAEPYFDTLGTLGDVYEDTDVFSLVGDWTDFGGGVDSDWYQGFRFASAASGPVHSIDVGVGYLAMPETMVLYLHEDDAGSLGALLATFEAQATADFAINEVIFELQPASPLCDTNDDGLCDVADIVGANGKIFGQPAYCARFPAP